MTSGTEKPGIRYLVKNVSKYTGTDPAVILKTLTVIYGKCGEILYMDGAPIDNTDLMSPYFVRQYGYHRACDAERAYSHRHPYTGKDWETASEIIKVEYIPNLEIRYL